MISFYSPSEKPAKHWIALEEAQAAVKEFLTASGHDLCQENRRKLALQFNVQDILPKPPASREEFRQECHNYEAEIYGGPRLEEKSTSQLPGLQKPECTLDDISIYLRSLPEDDDRLNFIDKFCVGICKHCGAKLNDEECMCLLR